ncbi:MAG: AraC family transcriptional regulator [Corticimicrobacter sp.]|uniref:helix-turn-helix domain-containing protein n=1 Tax=Corticimicrobacter sp. TaxID=2678536 RepID=UPI0032DB5BDD
MLAQSDKKGSRDADGLMGMVLNAGSLSPGLRAPVQEQNGAGLKLALLLGGSLESVLPGSAARQVSGPAFQLCFSEQPFEEWNRFCGQNSLDYVVIRLPQALSERLLVDDLEQLRQRQGGYRNVPASMWVLGGHASHTMQALGRQVMSCPLDGASGELYRIGKGLEMVALLLADLVSAGTVRRPDTAISVREANRLQQVRDRLLAQLMETPSLPTLAREAGLSVSRLTAGFRMQYGCSVYDFVREQRLQQAYRLLVSRGMSVSEVAWRCGYTDSHFSKAFRQRFGISPRNIRKY